MTSTKASPLSPKWNISSVPAALDLAMSNVTATPMHSSPSLEEQEPFVSLVVRITLSVLILVLNIAGNILVCLTVRRSRKLRSVRNFYYGLFLMSLAIADIAVGFFCIPFILVYYETGKYPFGFFGSTAVCKLIPALALLCQGASIFGLTSLTLQRFMGIVYPLKSRLTLRQVKFLLSLIWLCAFLSALPQIVVMDVNRDALAEDNKYSCDEFWGNPPQGTILKEGYTLYLFIAEYFLPLVIIGIAYGKMAIVMYRRDEGLEGKKSNNARKTKANHKKFIRLLVVLIASFAICYLPNHVLFFWLDYGTGQQYPYFSILMKYSHFFIWLNSCLNPYLYGALDDCFRKSYKRMLRRCARIEGKARKTHARLTRTLTNIYSVRTLSADPESTEIEADN